MQIIEKYERDAELKKKGETLTKTLVSEDILGGAAPCRSDIKTTAL